ncbi:MAG: TPM domain-containing protein [Candidatus Diapherotrites archaeon]|nr:TPM domain-containing protein [Candidatus Diapherotrites archaeon]
MNYRNFFFFFFCSFFIFSTLALPFDQVPNPSGYVNDFANILSPQEKESLEHQLSLLDENTSVEIAVVFIDSTEGKPIEDYAFDLGNQWKIGKQDVFNGVLILIAVDDRAWFIATAKGIEGTLPDLAVDSIGEEDFPNNFRSGNYFQGISLAIQDMEKYIQQDPEIVSKYSSTESSLGSEVGFALLSFLFPLFPFLFLFLFGGLPFQLKEDKKIPYPVSLFGINLSLLILSFLVFGAFFLFAFGFISFFGNTVFGFSYIASKGKGFKKGKYGGFYGGWRGGSGGSSGSGGFGGFGGGGGFSGGGGGGRW